MRPSNPLHNYLLFTPFKNKQINNVLSRVILPQYNTDRVNLYYVFKEDLLLTPPPLVPGGGPIFCLFVCFNLFTPGFTRER